MLTADVSSCGRRIWRAVDLGVVLFRAGLDGWRSPACRSQDGMAGAGARWLTRHSRQCLEALGVRVDWVGPVPDRGMLVANHLGYLDVLALASVVPATFVAKSEVRSGPLIGRLVQMAGTLWVDRTRRSAAARTMAEMDRLLKQGGLVVLFPEGTSSAGHSVLPFKSALLESACAAGQWWAAHIRYEVTDGSVEQEVAYWGEATFGLHLLNLLKKREIRARVRCERVTLNSTDRKQVARQLHAAVERLALETAVARPSAAGAASRPAQLELLPATGKAAIG